ncbi:RE1 [Symbiodinium sp. CCMP2456]|nr:RE1 [Symbiodinium sp. CCMP2456]
MSLAAEHRFMCHVLESEEGDEESSSARDAAPVMARTCELEKQARRMAGAAWDLLLEQGSSVVEGADKFDLCRSNVRVSALRNLTPVENNPDPNTRAPCATAEDEYLQTRLVAAEEVRKDLCAWKPSMVEEYTSLVHTTGTCSPMSQEDFAAVTGDPTKKVEVLPGKVIFSVKAKSGRKKTRIVGCGNFQQGSPRTKLDTHASGISAESIRLLVRFAGQAQWSISTTDIKTAFLNAPIVTPNEELIIVRVPSILRAANVCQEQFWQIQRALYGLDVAPRSWTLFRNKTLQEITELVDGTPVSCKPLQEDSNIWELFDEREQKVIAWIGVYVDDLMLVTPELRRGVVMDTLRSPWTTSEPEVVEEGKDVTFAGYELSKVGSAFHVHQRSYIREILQQWEVEQESTVPCVKEPPKIFSREDSLFDQTKRAQSIAGQLLWVSTHTRPDVCYAVQAVCQQIATDPAGACDAGLIVLQYLKRTIDHRLSYGPAPEDFGVWNELQFKRGAMMVEVFTDASFCPDESCKSVQSSMMFWGGRLVMWAGGRQSLIAASTAEAELISMVEGYSMGRAFLPTIEALGRGYEATAGEIEVDELSTKVLYGDNAAAIQLTQLDAGAWRTRHLRLRGAVLRQAVDDFGWRVTHLSGLYMPADIGTKVLGPSRFDDLIELIGLREPPSTAQGASGREMPKVAQAIILKVLLTVMLASLAAPAEASREIHPARELMELGGVTTASFCIGLGVSRDAAEENASQSGSQQQEAPSTTRVAREASLRETTYEELCYGVDRERASPLATAHSGETPYHPTYEDLLAAYPQELSEVEELASRLRESERFGQEYVDRCTYLRQLLSERCVEIERYREELMAARDENRRLQDRRNTDVPPGQSSTDQVNPAVQSFNVQGASLQVEPRPGAPEVRDPTVPLPGVAVIRYADDEAWIVPAQARREDQEDDTEDSELEGATTSSGEYTVRERSSDSSGGYQAGDARSDRGPSSPERQQHSSGDGSGTCTSLALAAAVGSLPGASGAPLDGDNCVAIPIQHADGGDRSFEMFGWGFLVGGLIVIVIRMLWDWLHKGRDTSALVHVNINNSVDTAKHGSCSDRHRNDAESSGEPCQVQEEKKAKQQVRLYMTPRGECLHLSKDCSTIRGSQVTSRPICKRCAAKSSLLH